MQGRSCLWCSERFQTFTYCRALCIYVHVKGQRWSFYHLGWTQLNWNVTAVVPSNLKALECCKPPAKQVKINSLTVQIYMITNNIFYIMLVEFLSTSRHRQLLELIGVEKLAVQPWSREAGCSWQTMEGISQPDMWLIDVSLFRPLERYKGILQRKWGDITVW